MWSCAAKWIIYSIMFFIIGAGLVSKMSPSSNTSSVSETLKKKNQYSKKNQNSKKKKKSKKKKSHDTSSPAPQAIDQPHAKVITAVEEPDSDSDDADLPASAVLTKRSFAPTSINAKSQKKTVNIKKKLIQKSTKVITTALQFQVGQKIMAQYDQGLEWFPGTIEKLQKGKKYVIRYDDGAREYQVLEDKIRSCSTAESRDSITVVTEEAVEQQAPTTIMDEEGVVNASEILMSSESSESSESDDGWKVVHKVKPRSNKTQTVRRRFDADTGNEILTKKQRESRRKKDRQREKKQELRSSAQEQGLHAKWGGTYNPAKKD